MTGNENLMSYNQGQSNCLSSKRTSLKNKRIRHLSISFLLLIFGQYLWGQQNQTFSSTNEYYQTLQEANSYYSQQQFDKAFPLYRKLVISNPDNSNLWLNYGYSAERLGQLDEAISALKKALDLGADVRYGVCLSIARLYAKKGDKNSALDWLENTLKARIPDRARFQRIPEFNGYENDERFRRIAGMLPIKQFTRDEGWRFDLQFLIEEARRKHPGFDTYNFKRPSFSVEFENAAKSLDSRISKLSDEQIITEMHRLVVMLGDGHSSVFKPPVSLPIDFYLFGDGLHIVRGLGDSKKYVGNKVLAFGQKETEQILKDLVQYIQRDNSMGIKWLSPRYLISLPVLQALGVANEKNEVILKLQNKKGETENVAIVGKEERIPDVTLMPLDDSPNQPLYMQNHLANFFLKALPENKAVYLKVNFLLRTPEKTIEQLSNDLGQQLLTTKENKNLIIDIRQNRGGNSFLIQTLVKSITHFKQISAEHRVYVIIGRSTFSTGMNLATALERQVGVIFVGEPTGSSPNFVGEDGPFRLPYSNTFVNISWANHYGSFWWDERKWIAPDIPVQLSSADYFSNHDPVLEAVFNLIKGKAT